MTLCPCCGQRVDTDSLLVSLETNTVSRRGHTATLSPTHIEILHKLQQTYPLPATHESLDNALYGKTTLNSRSEQPKLVVRVHISQMRRALRAMGIEIEPVYGVGYRMVVS